MKTQSIKGNSSEEVKIALQGSIYDGFRTTVVIVFISKSQNKLCIGVLLNAEEVVDWGDFYKTGMGG